MTLYVKRSTLLRVCMIREWMSSIGTKCIFDYVIRKQRYENLIKHLKKKIMLKNQKCLKLIKKVLMNQQILNY